MLGGRSTGGGKAPRKHHIIPAFFLAGFTENGSKTGRINVFDYDTGKRYASTPLKACRETDYNRVEEPGFDPNYTELALAELEQSLAPSVQKVGSGEAVDRLAIAQTLEFAALCAARTRRARESTGPTLAAGLASRLRSGEMSRGQWERLRASELRNGATLDEAPEYDKALRLLNDRKWYPRAPTVLTVGLVFDLANELYRVLMRKRWETHVTNSALNGGFVCSDNPLVWGDLDDVVRRIEGRRIGRPVSLSDEGVEVTFPVSKGVALVSHGGAREARCQTTEAILAHINARTLHFSGKMIFHAHDDFLTERRGGVIRKGSAYFSYVAEARRRGLDPE